ncbi:MAG TPA: ABC transporter permease [Acidimicrobiales bacterium]|nr:ABC transporter permease [Acidimicrobiales bacterium]
MTTTATTIGADRAVGPVDTRTGAAFAPAALAVTARTLRKFVRTPNLIILGTIQSATFLLLFRYVFGGAISIAGLPYVNFLVPGFITTGVLFLGMGAAIGMAEDIAAGFFDRLRSLPIPPSSVVCGRAFADTTMIAWGTAVSTAIGFAVGFRVETGVAAALAAFACCVLFGFAFLWLFMTMGLTAGSPQAAQGMTMIVFPLAFVSSAYVPVRTMPGWLQAFAAHQPLTYMVDTVRILTLGHPAAVVVGHSLAYELTGSLLWCAALVAAFAPTAVARFKRG